MTEHVYFLGPAPAEEDCVQVGAPDYARDAKDIRLDRRGIRHLHSNHGAFEPIHGEVWYENGKRRSSPEYRSWQAMRTRCNNPNNADWHLYGGKGIQVDPAWDDYRRFLDDMGRRPSPAHTLDRIDSSKHYTKENCRWATHTMQGRNTTNTKLTMEKARYIRSKYEHTKASAFALAKEVGVSVHTIHAVVQGKAWKEEPLSAEREVKW